MKLEDIAKLAGVSKGAVSLALNGKKGISEAKRKEILEIAQAHHYQPLRKTRKPAPIENIANYTIRFITCSTPPFLSGSVQSLPYFSELLSDLANFTQNLPTSLLINTFSFESMLEELQEAEKLHPSDGIILLGTGLPDESIKQIIQAHHNVVVVDTSIPYFDGNFISMNNYQGAYTATEYLIQSGHRKIGYAFGDVRLHNFQERQRGFRYALQEHAIPIQKRYFLEFPATVIAPKPELIKKEELPTAFFCENDTIAISLIKSLQQHHIRVPEDISVIGFDNIAESRVLTPELTTINVNRSELVRQAIQKIMRVISDSQRENSSHTLINTTIIHRQSVRSID